MNANRGMCFLVAAMAALAEGLAAQSPDPATGIYPDSQMRLPAVKREHLDDYGQRVYDRFLSPGDPRAPIRGPNAIRLYSPVIADHLYTVNQYLRRVAGLGDRLTELAILNAAREVSSQYEWSAHEGAAQSAGLEQPIIDIVKFRKELPPAAAVAGLGEKESFIIRLARAMFRDKNVPLALFSEGRRLFGDKGLVELVSLMAHYAATGYLLNTFGNVPAPSPNRPMPLP